MNQCTKARGVQLVTYSIYDVVVLSQKLVLCSLMSPELRSRLNAFGSLIITLCHSIVALLLWLRLRPHRTPQTRHIALLLCSCVIGLQAYCLVAATRWDASSVLRSPTSPWRFGFNVTMFCYVVGCIAYCLVSVVRSALAVIRGPTVAHRRQKSFRKTVLTERVWVDDLAVSGFTTSAAARAFTARRANAKGSSSTGGLADANAHRRQRVSSIAPLRQQPK